MFDVSKVYTSWSQKKYIAYAILLHSFTYKTRMSVIYMYCLNTAYPPGYHHNGFIATGALGHTHAWLKVGEEWVRLGRPIFRAWVCRSAPVAIKSWWWWLGGHAIIRLYMYVYKCMHIDLLSQYNIPSRLSPQWPYSNWCTLNVTSNKKPL